MADQRAFDFLRSNRREEKPRSRGLTEIRAPITASSDAATWRISSKASAPMPTSSSSQEAPSASCLEKL